MATAFQGEGGRDPEQWAVGGGRWRGRVPPQLRVCSPAPRPARTAPSGLVSTPGGPDSASVCMGTGGWQAEAAGLPRDPRATRGLGSCRPALPSKGKASVSSCPSTGAWGRGSRGLTRPGALAHRGPPESPGPGIPQRTEKHILWGCCVPPGPSPSQDALRPGSSIPGLPDLTPILQAARTQGIFNKN